MKKIIYIYGNLPAYREEFFTDLSKKLESDGVELKVFYGFIANKVTKQAEAKEFKVEKFETTFKNLKLIRLSRMEGLFERVKEENPDGIIFQYNQTNLSEWEVRSWCLKNKIPYGIWGCNYTRADLNGGLAKLREKIYHPIYRKATMLIPYGTLYRYYFLRLGIPADKVIVAQNSINVEGIVERNPDLANVGESKTLRILYVGALAPQKLLESSLSAVNTLITEGADIRLDVVGGGVQLDVLKNMLATYTDAVKERIVLHGPKYGDELPAFFKNSDVFLMPGTGGLGVNEAMAYGLPIISTHGDETVYDLIDGNGWFLKKFGSVEEQIEALRWFMSKSIEERKAMGALSRKLILERASLKNMVEKHALACEKMIGVK